MIRLPSRTPRIRWLALTVAIFCTRTFADLESSFRVDDAETLSSATFNVHTSRHEEARELDGTFDGETFRLQSPRRRTLGEEEEDVDDDDSHRLRHGEWHHVDYRGVGHTVLQLDLNEPCAIYLRVTELGHVGGRIQVRDGPDHVLGLTSQGRKGYCDESDPDACYEHSDAASSGEFALEPGPHNVQVRVVSAPYSRGRIAVRIDREMCPETSR